MTTPRNFKELFKFYDDYVKLLYSQVQINNQLPVEVLFELNAALDHISRKWNYSDKEEYVVEKAFSHLKRSCLDIFKLQVKNATDQFNELRKIDTSIINNGEFDRELVDLYYEIKTGARYARKEEGDTRSDKNGYVKAFDLWEPVYENALKLENDFYYNKHIEWARHKNSMVTLKTFIISLAASILAIFFSKEWIISFFQWLVKLFRTSPPATP